MTDAVTVDHGFSLTDMAVQFRNLRGENLTFVTSPHLGSQTINGESVVVSDREKALAMYQRDVRRHDGRLGEGEQGTGDRQRLTYRLPHTNTRPSISMCPFGHFSRVTWLRTLVGRHPNSP